MSDKKNISFRTPGTSELSRFWETIDPTYFGVDERSLSDILTFILEYSESVQYVNLQNKTDNNWSPFFKNNLAFVIASISSTDLDSYSNKFKKAIRKIDSEIANEDKQSALKALLELTFQLFQLFNQWHKSSRYDLIHLEKNKLSDHLKNAIRVKLAPELNSFKRLVDKFNKKIFKSNKVSFSFEDFDYVWDMPIESEDVIKPEIQTNELKVAIKDISRIFKSVIAAATYLKNIAPELLEYILTQYPYHPPHVSLLTAFLKAFKHVQDDSNEITRRHLDYYYGKILKQNLRPSRPDKVHVYLEPADHIIKSTIPAQTLLAAGIDEEGMVHTYATDYDFELNQANISELKVIHVAKNPIIGVGNTFRSVSNIYSRSISINENGRPLDNSNNPIRIDSFGKDQVDTSYENRDMDQAKIGFAISSSILVLNEGERNLSLKYKFNLNSLSALISFIEEFTKREDLSPENAFYKLLSNIFTLRYTTEVGWFEVENYEILPPETWSSGEIRIEMILDVADPPMTMYNKEVHGDDFNASWPVLEFKLSSQHSMYAYSYLKDLQIEECEINVDVKNSTDLHVFNDLGKLDISKPFYPFGSTPDLGSYFLVGNKEMLYKNIQNFSLDIHWHNLPKMKGGFKEYYKEYNTEVDSESFKLGVTGLSDFRFHPVDETDIQKINLFSDDRIKNTISETSRFENIDLDKLELKPYHKEVDVTEYSGKTRSGFLKFEILEPEFGFGHSEYPKLFANAILEKSKSSGLLSKEQKKVDLPNEPYAPQIRNLSLNYAASTTLKIDVNKVAENDRAANDQIYHLHPFGNRVVFEQGLPKSNTLLPQFEEEGYLIIGLEDVQAPIELSLYFEVEDNVKNEINQADIPSTKWLYLVNDEWVEFEENEVISDGTNNFTTSGIVRLKIPSAINDEHNILSSGKYWLSVSTEYNTQVLSKTVLVKTNGLKATWKPHKAGEQWTTYIPAETISGFLETRSDVNGVFQPFPSFGGRPLESKKYYYTRIAERLKHKNRAITPEDYEKIVLDRFPYLFQVKCINHFSHPDFVKKGLLKLIVVPKLNQEDTFYAPKVDYNQLSKIGEYIRSSCSPYAQIEVISPVYERVKVILKVVFEGSSNAGENVKKLENDLTKFICPWFSKNQSEMNFGGGIERDDILSFVDSLSYVRFVTKLSVIVLHNINGKFDISDSASNEGRKNELYSSTPWSVLVPSKHHEIEIIDKPAYEMASETRIETMKIGEDFVISDEKEDDVKFPHFDLDKDTYYAIEIDL